MTSVDEIFDRLAQANPEPDEAAIDDPTMAFDALIRDLGRIPPAGLEKQPSRPGRARGPLVGLATALAATVAVAAAMLLVANLAEEGPVDAPTPAATTGPPDGSLEPATPPEVDPALVEAGNGPRLLWTRVEGDPPLGHHLAWFAGAFYSIDGTTMHRSPDGFTWEPVSSFEAAVGADFVVRSIAAGLERFVVVGHRSVARGTGSQECPEPPPALVVAIGTGGSDWTVSDIPLETPAAGRGVCVQVFPGPVAAGRAGILVTGSVGADPAHGYEMIAREALGDALEDAHSMQVVGDLIIVNTDDGRRHEISIIEAGYTAEDFARPAETGAVGWWSSDGASWTRVTRDGPMRSPAVSNIVATDDGFLVTAFNRLFSTSDGSSWDTIEPTFEGEIFDWAGTTVQATAREIRRLGGERMAVSDAFEEFFPRELSLGDLGMVTWSLIDNRTLVFSPNGEVWRRWLPEEFARAHIEAIAVGRDRVLALAYVPPTSEPSPGEPSLWVGFVELGNP